MGDGDGLPGPTDAWITLAGLARETSRIRLGTLITRGHLPLPALLAISVAQVDEMSGGRVELGLGAGWFDEEHAAYGIPFPAAAERFDRLEEQLAIVSGLWETPHGERFSFDGKYYPVRDSPGPAQAGAAAAPADPDRRHAGRADAAAGGAVRRRVQRGVQHASSRPGPRSAGSARHARRPGGTRPMMYSAAQVACCGRDAAELARRAAAIGREPDELRGNGLAGTPAEIVDRIGEFAGLGAERIYLQVLDLHDLDHLELIASEVMPQVR